MTFSSFKYLEYEGKSKIKYEYKDFCLCNWIMEQSSCEMVKTGG